MEDSSFLSFSGGKMSKEKNVTIRQKENKLKLPKGETAPIEKTEKDILGGK